jgi:probable HAF family extracellular repeat protein
VARDINGRGLVVGTVQSGPAFHWDAARGFVALPGLSGASGGALGVNDPGQTVGASTAADGRQHAVLWDVSGTVRSLGVSSTGFAAAREINNAGQVVGDFGLSADSARAFFWEAGRARALLDLVENPAGWTALTRAWSINNRGEIVGEGQHSTLGAQGYLLTPIPEPAALALVIVAALLHARRRLWRTAR